MVLVLLLHGCGGSGHRVKVLDVPKESGLKGTQKPYEVDGVRYDPLLTADQGEPRNGARPEREKEERDDDHRPMGRGTASRRPPGR